MSMNNLSDLKIASLSDKEVKEIMQLENKLNDNNNDKVYLIALKK